MPEEKWESEPSLLSCYCCANPAPCNSGRRSRAHIGTLASNSSSSPNLAPFPHSLHKSPQQNSALPWKFRSVVQSFCELVEHPVQIFVVLPLLLDLVNGMHYGRVMLASELTANFRQ